MKPRRNYARSRRGENRTLWLLFEILVVLGGGIAIALIAGNLFPEAGQDAETRVPSVETGVLASPTIPPETSQPTQPAATETPPTAPTEAPSPTELVAVPTTPNAADLCSEPNTDWDTAYGPLACPGTYRCLIWPEGDLSDFYFVDLAEESMLDIRLSNIPPETSLNLHLFDPDRRLLASSEEPAQADERITYRAAPGRYYVAIKAMVGANETMPYQLDLDCTPLSSPTTPIPIPETGPACDEPNSSFDSAYGPISCNQAFRCDLNPGGGDLADVYYIDVETPGTIEITLSEISEDSNWRLQLFSANEVELASSDNDGNADEHITYAARPGRFYVAVLVSRASIRPGSYVLRVACVAEVPTPTPVPTETSTPTATVVGTPTPTSPPTPTEEGPCAEPNDDSGTARGPVACGQSYNCRLAPQDGDLIDLYYVDVPEPTILIVGLTGMPEGGDWDLSLMDVSGNLLDFSGGVLNEDERITYLAEPGRYLVAVEAVEDGLPAGSYVFTVYCEAPPTPTQTYTRVPTDTPQPTQTPSGTRTLTRTKTPTYTRTFTITRTGTSTRTPTRTTTPSRTDTPTRTGTPTRTATETWIATATITPTPTETLTPSSTFTATPTGTVTQTGTATPTGTATLSPTWTLTFTPTGTPTLTWTPTDTVLATSTPTGTLAISIIPGRLVAPGDDQQSPAPRWQSRRSAPLLPAVASGAASDARAHGPWIRDERWLVLSTPMARTKSID